MSDDSGVAVRWATGWAKSCGRARVPGKTIYFRNNFLVTVKMRTSGYQTLECFIATLPTAGVYWRRVHVGETFNRFADYRL